MAKIDAFFNLMDEVGASDLHLSTGSQPILRVRGELQRVKFPPNYRVAPHTHPYAEVVTVLSGTLGSGMGEKFEAKGDLLKPGGLFALPAKHPHYVWTATEETVVQVQFTGPGGIDFINPADDPRKK